MKIKRKISKTWAVRLALFTALTAVAIIGDVYLKKHHVNLSEIVNTTQDEDIDSSESYYAATPSSNVSISFTQNFPSRNLFFKSHNRFLQNIHQIRNKQILRMKIKLPPPPSIRLAMVIKMKENHYLSLSDEDFIR